MALLEDSLGYQVDWDSVEQRRRARRDELIILRPGVIGLLDRAVAAGMRIAIVSNAPDWWVNGRLASTGLDQYPFAAIITKEPGMCPKPAPDAYLAALRALDVAACEAIAFEDSPVGLAAARAAGVFCVGVPNDVTKHLSLAEADLICASLAEIVLPELLRRVMR